MTIISGICYNFSEEDRHKALASGLKGDRIMRTIYLIRHGHTDIGPGYKSVCLGRKDVPLIQEGVKQAERLALYFRDKKIDAVYSSPLIRCRETARILTEKSGHKNLPIYIEEDFTEVDTGEWDGLPFTELMEKYPEEYAERGKRLGTYVIRGGESLEKAGERFAGACEKVLAESSGDILIVAHAGVIRSFLCRLTGTDTDDLLKLVVPAASVTILEDVEGDSSGGPESRAADSSGGPESREADSFGRSESRETDENRVAGSKTSLRIRVTGLRPVQSISLSEVDRMWTDCRATAAQRRHMEAVAGMAMNLVGYDREQVRADRLDTAWSFEGAMLNVRAIYYAALLHDIKRSEGGRVHAARGAEYLAGEGYLELAELVKAHHDPTVFADGKPVSEAEVLFLADKLVMEDRMVSIEERFARSRKKCKTPEAIENHERQYRAAMGIREKLR